jgi:hypothetical protein
MNKPDYDSLYVTQKKEHYDLLVKQYLEYEDKYEDLIKAIDDYNNKVKPKGHRYRDFIYIDDFGHKTPRNDCFKWELVKEMNDCKGLKNWLTVMIEDRLPKIIVEHQKKREENKSVGRYCHYFDHSYFDNFVKADAVKLIAYIDAYENFDDYLGKRRHEILNNNSKSIVEGILLRYHDRKGFISDFYHELILSKFIFVSENEFEIHFNKEMKIKQMSWGGNLPQLLFLFSRLKTKNSNNSRIIMDHFYSKSGKQFTQEWIDKTTTTMKLKQTKIDTIFLPLMKYSY